MEINKLSNVAGVSRVNSVHRAKVDEGAAGVSQKQEAAPKQDVVDVKTTQFSAPPSDVTFSGVKVNGIRTDLVNRVRAEIASGTYETPEKMEVAFDKLLENLFG